MWKHRQHHGAIFANKKVEETTSEATESGLFIMSGAGVMLHSLRKPWRSCSSFLRRKNQYTTCRNDPASCILRFLSYRRRTPGQGGTSEERYIANAIRRMKEMNPSFVVEVMNTCNVGVTQNLFPVPSVPRNAQVLLRILTRADLLSDEALCYQMNQAAATQQRGNYKSNGEIAVFALDLRNADRIKPKSLRPIMNALVGGAKLASNAPSALVCGTPNAGKSSFVLPLTKHRTMTTKKKKEFHLPKIASTAGWTLSTKKHLLEIGNKTVTLIDTPGLRPRMEYVANDMGKKALLIACGAMEPTKGMLDEELTQVIAELLLKALNRHGSFSPDLPYVQALGLEAPTQDPTEFIKAFKAKTSHQGAGVALDLVRQCRAGHLGGLLFEDEPTAMASPESGSDNSDELVINRYSPIVCMNSEAKCLIDVGTGREEVQEMPMPRTKPPAAEKTSGSKSNELKIPLNCVSNGGMSPERPKSHSKMNKSGTKAEIVLLPESQRDSRCMKCAGFIKQASQNGGGDLCGVRHNRCLNWNEDDIRSYYSRMTEAFGGHVSAHTRYLMRDSLACTLAAKYKLRSRRKVYKKLGKSLGGYPVPNDKRPRHFQSDQPVPLKWKCTSRAKTSCRARSEEGDEESKVIRSRKRRN